MFFFNKYVKIFLYALVCIFAEECLILQPILMSYKTQDSTKNNRNGRKEIFDMRR